MNLGQMNPELGEVNLIKKVITKPNPLSQEGIFNEIRKNLHENFLMQVPPLSTGRSGPIYSLIHMRW